jgi:hypothetical protein
MMGGVPGRIGPAGGSLAGWSAGRSRPLQEENPAPVASDGDPLVRIKVSHCT